MVWAGANLCSYEQAAESMVELAEQPISARRIRRQVEAIGHARVEERIEQVELLKTMTFAERRTGSSTANVPNLSVTMMDGGRYQRRDYFGEKSPPAGVTRHHHWRESKVGCLLSMESPTYSKDPCELIPDSFAHASVVQEIAKMAEKQVFGDDSSPEEVYKAVEARVEVRGKSTDCRADFQPPKLLSRDVIASGQCSNAFGWQLESRARQLNFHLAPRQAFVASWPSVLADDEVLAGAILDRLLHRATVLNIQGRSYRLKELDTQLSEHTSTTTVGSQEPANAAEQFSVDETHPAQAIGEETP